MDPHFLNEEGQKYGDFVLTRKVPIDELQLTFRELLHLPTGAQVMHLENEDPENLFCLSFQTLPRSSDGAPHILEHTVLCGSRKYPVRDPFFSMSRRSLNTFMNAMTGSDFTCYPASTQIEKDFYNLLEVYLDAVFHPELHELAFLQEGHRFEFAEHDNPSSPLEIKGIVYNEMKGAMTSIDSRIWHAMMEEIVPDLPYAFNSGGDPKVIPHLSYAKLIDFHETFYHPSRCLFFFYGNFPLKKHLDFIQKHALKKVPRLSPLPDIGHQKRFSSPVKREMEYPVAEKENLEDKHIHAFGWLTVPLLEQEEVLALSILDSVLMDTDASPLKKALLETKLCVHAESVIDIEMTEVPWIFFFKGCKKENGPLLEAAVRKELKKIAKEGISHELVASSLHQIELSKMEITGGHSPFGLTLFFRSGLAKMLGCDPTHALTLHSLFGDVLEKSQNPHYFTPFIEKYLLENNHFVSLSLAPNPDLTTNEAEEEKATLAKIKKGLSEKEIAHIVEQSEKLLEAQDVDEGTSIECLPKVTLADVPEETRHFSLDTRIQKNLHIHHHEVFTNHIIYADLVFDLAHVEEEDLFYLQLFLFFWNELGTEKWPFEEKLKYLHAHTGGVATHCSLHVQADNAEAARPSLQIRGRALERNIGKLFPMMEEMILRPRFDEKERITTLFKKLKTSMENRLTQNAMRYASQTCLAEFSIPSYVNEHWYGLTFYQKILTLGEDLEGTTQLLMKKFAQLRKQLLPAGMPDFIVSSDKNLFDAIDKQGFFGLTELPKKKILPWQGGYSPKTVGNRAYEIPSQVAFTAHGFHTVSYLHESAPALFVAAALMEDKVLHHRIREKGGAYGAGASYNPLWGNFYFHSYRDPHIARTLRTFSHAIDSIGSGSFNKRDLEEAKLGIIQHADAPTAPGNQGMVAYVYERDGKTRQARQLFRDRLLATTADEIQAAVQTHLIPGFDRGNSVSFAGKELLNKELPNIEGKELVRHSIS